MRIQYANTDLNVAVVGALQLLAQDLQPYFIGYRSGVEEEKPLPGIAYFYAKFYEFAPTRTLARIEIDIRAEGSPPPRPLLPPLLFWAERSQPDHPRFTEPGIEIYVNGFWAGWYLPESRCLLATSWVHNPECAQFAKRVLPELIKTLGLKPLSDEERKGLLRRVGVPAKGRRPKVSVGCDPEFELWRRGRVLRANRHLSFDGPLGTDGAGGQVEIRPDPGTPAKVVSSIREILRTFAERFPDADLDAMGHRYPCGGHIHVGGVPNRPPAELIRLLDDFVGRVTSVFNGRGRMRSCYGRLGDYRTQPHGFEYRTPPAAVFSNPRLARVTLKLVRNLVAQFYSGQVIEYDETSLSLDDYVRIGGLTRNEAEYFLGFFSQPIPPRHLRMRAAWLGNPSRSSVAVTFRDEWAPGRQQAFRAALARRRLPRGLRLVLYGLDHTRGAVATIPGIPGTTVIDSPYPPVADDGSVWIGLPWSIRQGEVSDAVIRATADAIARYCRTLRNSGR